MNAILSIQRKHPADRPVAAALRRGLGIPRAHGRTPAVSGPLVSGHIPTLRAWRLTL